MIRISTIGANGNDAAAIADAAMAKALRRLGLAMLSLGVAQASAWQVASAQPPAGNSGQSCWQVQIGGQKPSPYACLNQQLAQEVQGTAAASPALPLAAGSPSNQVGGFNALGVSEQYGKNFGRSDIPYRPSAPVYGNALHP